eukprot:TRINITY_DN9_c0_g1_i2.p3 TRINITY_DN9_c0_g1~~TRINITY_DN9_c0_g1_i2.p3  ORF type:complete len:201 (-),score=29.77 TRINITY_DN9_c0_g1_i2:230-832(-)
MYKVVVIVCFLILSLASYASAVCMATSATSATSKSVDAYTESFVTVFKDLKAELNITDPTQCSLFTMKEVAEAETSAIAEALAEVKVQTSAVVLGGPNCRGVAVGFGGAGAKAIAFAIAGAYSSAMIQVFPENVFAFAQNTAVAQQCEEAYAEVECGTGTTSGISFETCDDLALATAEVVVRALSEALVEIYKCQDCTVC